MALPLVALLASVLMIQGAVGWTYGRATFYGDEPWYWDIHHGSCGYGYLWPDQNTGWDIAALSDQFPGYAGSCGRCYEVQCDNGHVNDGFGQSLDRNVCKDAGASVVVRTTDTCPCWYPNNAFSNKRWCCGDKPHMDLSVWAFSKLADRRWGVIGIKYREVDCGYQPSKRASGGGATPVFPDYETAKKRPDFKWWDYFNGGGYISKTGTFKDLNSYMSAIGRGSQAQYGKKK